MKIEINVDGLEKNAIEIQRIVSELKTNMNHIENIVMSVEGEWQGAAELAYVAKILYLKKEFNLLYDFMIDFSQVLSTIANDYNELENNLKKKMEL